MPIVSFDDFMRFANTDGFHYVVVGGGTCGLVLASRLTENPKFNVAILEAGDRHMHIPEIDTPGFIGRILEDPRYDWMFNTVQQSNANERVIPQPRGKGLGGSTLLNYLYTSRPSKYECNDLENFFENKGWNWEVLLQSMKKSEESCFTKSHIHARTALDLSCHGFSGPIKKSLPISTPELEDLTMWFFDAAEELGVLKNHDPFNGDNTGSSVPYSTIDPNTAMRSSAASGYLEPILGRPNLMVLTGALVTKILLSHDGDNSLQQAIGVEFCYCNSNISINNVKHDVILSAGSFKTPQILELSGIGNPEILKQNGIESLVNSPGVGENLQDHVAVPMIFEIDDRYTTVDIFHEPEEFKKHHELYLNEKKGMLVKTPSQAFLFLPAHHVVEENHNHKSWSSNRTTEALTILSKASTPLPVKSGIEKQYELQKQWFLDSNIAEVEIIEHRGHLPVSPQYTPIKGKRYVSLTTAIMHPLSRGTVHISSSDPLSSPNIDPKLLDCDSDLDLLLRGMEWTLKLCRTSPFKDAIRGMVFPKPDDALDKMDPTKLKEKLKAHARGWCRTFYHPVGTAAMAKRKDGGVVDEQLRVYGTNNLRVVDLSILPIVFSCHTMSLAYAIAEQAATIIQEEYRNK